MNVADTAAASSKESSKIPSKKRLTTNPRFVIIIKSHRATGSLKTEQYSELYADVQDFLSRNNLSNRQEIIEPNKQSIMESLILAQDERWRRA